MQPKICKPEVQSIFGEIADLCYLPFMMLLQAFVPSRPQRGHVHNATALPADAIRRLDHELMIDQGSDPNAGPAFFFGIPLMHMPILPGGWRRYAVIEPVNYHETWHPGWWASHGHGVGYSKIPITGPVRLMIGPEPVKYYGLNSAGQQIQVKKVDEGRFFVPDRYKWLPLR